MSPDGLPANNRRRCFPTDLQPTASCSSESSMMTVQLSTDVAPNFANVIERDRRLLVLPPAVRLLSVLRILPPRAFDWVMDMSGLNVSMNHFSGHGGGATPSLKQHTTHAPPGGRYGRAEETYKGASPVSCAKISAILNSISANLSR